MAYTEAKTTQAAARLLSKTGGKMNYMLLIKMLYMADRRALLESGLPISYDTYYTMKNGPILSFTLELITKPQNFKSEHEHPWLETFEVNNYDILSKAEFDKGELSEYEERILDDTFEEFKHFLDEEPFNFPKWMHRNLREVKTIQGGRISLDVEDILIAENKTPEEISFVLSNIESVELIDTLVVK
jgi:hypothetical protein